MEALALPPETDDGQDQFVYLHPVAWKDYLRLLALRGDRSVPRMTYCEGVLELMSPSIDHEYAKKTLARLLEAWAQERGLELSGYGSWTLRRKAKERGLEPDECYVLGPARKARPDLAIEVVWTYGDLDKTDIYAQLGVGELWVWERGALSVFVLERGAYLSAPRSRLLPALDLALLAHYATVFTQLQAVRGFLAATTAAG